MLNLLLVIIALGVGQGGGSGTAFAQAESAPAASDTPAAVPTATQGRVAEDQTPSGKFLTATEVKPILTATKANWVAVREWEGQDLVYVTHIWSWRCGLFEMQVSVNGEAPQVWPLPDCRADTAQPAAITEADGLPYAAFPLGSVQRLEVTLLYDDLSRDSAAYDRAAVLMP